MNNSEDHNNSSKDNDQKEVEPQSKGEILKQAREERGLSLESVHDATKIPMDALKAIEEGYTIRTLSPFYIKGFMKIYARYLGLNEEEVIDEPAVKKPVYKKPEPPSIREDLLPDVDIQLMMKKFFTRQRKKQITYILGGIFVLFLLFKFIGFIANRKPAPKKKSVNSQTTPSTASTTSVRSESKPVESQPVQDPVPRQQPVVVRVPQVQEPATVKKQQKEVRLIVRALKDSWVRVKADGKIVFQSTLRAGNVESWDADEKIEITGRNINQLEFELNGDMIGRLGREDRRAKEVVITKKGLKVNK